MADRKTTYARARRLIAEKLADPLNMPDSDVNLTEAYCLSAETLEGYSTLDWQMRQTIRRLGTSIRAYWNAPQRKRPLCIFLLAGPGSGKSYLVERLSKSLKNPNTAFEEYNLTAMHSPQDLEGVLQKIRDLKVSDENPVLFLDEIDSKPSNYAMLLPLMWDGALQISDRLVQIGKCVIVLAASSGDLESVVAEVQDPEKLDIHQYGKIPDFISRIGGGVHQIPDLELQSAGRDRRADKVCMAISLLQKRFGDDLVSFPWPLLAFVARARFRFGARSISRFMESFELHGEVKTDVTAAQLQLPLGSSQDLADSSFSSHLCMAAGGSPVDVWSAVESNNVQVVIDPKACEEILDALKP